MIIDQMDTQFNELHTPINRILFFSLEVPFQKKNSDIFIPNPPLGNSLLQCIKSHCCKYTHTKKDDGKAKYIEKSQPLPQHMWIRRVNKGCDIKLLYFVFMQMKQKINRSLLIFITNVNSEYFSKKQFFRFYLHNKSLPCNNLDHSSMFKYHITFVFWICIEQI